MIKRPYGIIILAFSLFLFSFGAGKLSHEFKGDENFYFESAKEMMESGDLLTPRYMGEPRFQKPVFFYWMILASFKVLGANWYAARLPSIIFGALLALIVFALSNILFGDKKTGVIASLLLMTTPLYYRYARLALPDMALIFFITAALYSFLRLRGDGTGKKSLFIFFLALASAFLVKGPVGIIVPLLIISIFCLVKRENPFRAVDILAGIAVFFIIVIPWFYTMYRTHGQAYLNHIWVREISQRLGQDCRECFFITYFKGFAFYLSALATKFLPYSLFLPAALIRSSSVLSGRASEGSSGRVKDAHLFLCLWAVTVFLFFTFVAERRTHYLLALSPAISILLGSMFSAVLSDGKSFNRAFFRIPFLVTLAGLGIFAVAFIFSDVIMDGSMIPAWKLVLLTVPAVLIFGYRNRNDIFAPASIALSLSILYCAMTVSAPFGLLTNKMERAALVIKGEFKEGDGIGIGSHGIIPEELQAFFDTPVENVKARRKADGTPGLDTAYPLERFLGSKKKIFCVIKKKDYEDFVSDKKKGDLRILGSYYVWKRRIRFDDELQDSLGRAFREIFQNEIYVVSNRE